MIFCFLIFNKALSFYSFIVFVNIQYLVLKLSTTEQKIDRGSFSLAQVEFFVVVILVVQPSGRLVNSLDRIDGGLLQWMDSRFCGPLSALDRVTLSVLRLQQFQPSAGRHQA